MYHTLNAECSYRWIHILIKLVRAPPHIIIRWLNLTVMRKTFNVKGVNLSVANPRVIGI